MSWPDVPVSQLAIHITTLRCEEHSRDSAIELTRQARERQSVVPHDLVVVCALYGDGLGLKDGPATDLRAYQAANSSERTRE